MSDASELAAGIADTLTGVRRVVQIACRPDGVYALCSDGTMWWHKGGETRNGKDHWERIADVPQP